jgi:hypothetical protein
MKLEQLLQCEVEQQYMQTNIRRATLRSLATKGMFDRTVVPTLKVLSACSCFVLDKLCICYFKDTEDMNVKKGRHHRCSCK